jgi:hypothetical protein
MGQTITETIKNITDAPANKGLLGLIKHEGFHKEKGKLLPALDIPLKDHDGAVYGLKVPTGALSVKTISDGASISSSKGQLRAAQTSCLNLDIGVFMSNFS